ncbi:nickel pincer cofactor biosynthesis protein LarC [Methanococcoides orientis]|uniref:nickel pincer cofactor biosynthesis protein LarC n=1 Tax=Methanococcoides orientis TaxID=2822137 RepID=UPI001E2ECC62|nr:nickel pincer cofactor biosynthesis protein LarC [Methanococcoides orientis]UGV41821.1 nickel pincer cofactor biosynthesis protein LarC [Methanococcoides orientis]
MRSLIFEPFSGASGDMILGGLVGLGMDKNELRDIIESSVNVTVSAGTANKCGIEATDVHIRTHDDKNDRRYEDLINTIIAAALPAEVEKSALGVFRLIGEAESRVHGKNLEELHFHEVGQDDALADVIGSCYAIHKMKADHIFCTPVNVGGGSVKAAHGTFPVPAPATLEIMKESGFQIYSSGERELLTPTGAAILAYFAKPVDRLPMGKILETGYGAGDADTEMPNVLRTMLMDVTGELSRDSIEVLETNVDDVTGEVLGNLFEKLMEAGAKDVAITPTTMKKGRSGHIIQVIAKPEDSARIAGELMRQTGTLGVRVIPTKHRFIADRRMDSVTIAIADHEYKVAVKIAQDRSGEILHISAEYEDCRRVSDITGLPLKEVMRRAEETAWKRFTGL